MGSGEADSDCACSCADTEPVIKGVSIIGDCCLLPDSLISAMTPALGFTTSKPTRLLVTTSLLRRPIIHPSFTAFTKTKLWRMHVRLRVDGGHAAQLLNIPHPHR
ncbi:unnamed protein product [Taenia asiatica]|uniref:Major capsid protein n=1 Tax=Taenia asiatica TaxID=60517 RepID=A0A0R3VVN7_TAEAS|nr:unnamed protein product [Taenia asiatica]